MITWICGNSQSGKTTLSSSLLGFYKHWVRLDGDLMRGIWRDLDLSKQGRWEQNLREEVRKITKCKFIFIEGGKKGKDYPFDNTITLHGGR